MNDNRIEGTKHQIKGTVKEGAGKLTGDTSQEIEGKVEKNAGKLQKEVGKTQEDLTDDD
jgi:uncharacterized protein YjbJ (UPF0337 family)